MNEGDTDGLLTITKTSTTLVEGAQKTPSFSIVALNKLNLGTHLYCIYVEFDQIPGI
jgi:hypothetical protein